MSTINGIVVPEEVRMQRQRGIVVLAPEAKAIADEALPRQDRLRECSVQGMVHMARALEAQGETDSPTLFDGWARLLYHQVAPKRQAAILAFDAALESIRKEDPPPVGDPVGDPVGEKRESCGDDQELGDTGPEAQKRFRADESNLICTSRGPLGLKDDAEPNTNRAALSDRAWAHIEQPPAAATAAAPAPGKLIKGGTCGTWAPVLKAGLKRCGYDFKDTGKFGVILFGKDGGTDAVKFNGKVFDRSLPQDAGMDDFQGTNILPVNLGDPTDAQPWSKADLAKYYDVVDAASGWLKEGKVVIVACVAGANRSVGVCRALQPKGHSWPAPTCPSMDAAAAGWRAGRDLMIAPLAPPPKTATTRAGARQA